MSQSSLSASPGASSPGRSGLAARYVPCSEGSIRNLPHSASHGPLAEDRHLPFPFASSDEIPPAQFNQLAHSKPADVERSQQRPVAMARLKRDHRDNLGLGQNPL